MKIKSLITFILIFMGLSIALSQTVDPMLETQIKDGDIIFIKTDKANSLLPNGNSKFNYAGVIFLEDEVPMVYYATEPLKKINIDEFKKMSLGGDFIIKRLIEQEVLTKDVIDRMRGWAKAKLGVHYDNKIKLNNDELYNAEFVWKIYKSCLGLPLSEPKEIKEYKIEDANAKEFLIDAFGEKVFEEKIVAIGDLYRSTFLEDKPK
ncbi:MAG: YiiX/YebB-like N1pC/P60 family cysteine hydrolase [Bacteroidota bacterium]|nr:YiiX/YebB-like N1pC/P60 family cysteine hydrolase [Bacteroidota bacterium]